MLTTTTTTPATLPQQLPTVNHPASAQLAWAMGLHPYVQGLPGHTSWIKTKTEKIEKSPTGRRDLSRERQIKEEIVQMGQLDWKKKNSYDWIDGRTRV
jgi:hypothetical protein